MRDYSELTIGEQALESEFEKFSDVQREQARVAGQRAAPGLTLSEHFAPDTATFRELEVWHVHGPDGEPAYDVWLSSVPRGVVFVAGTNQVVGELKDGSPDTPAGLVRAAIDSASAQRSLLGRWARRTALVARALEATAIEQPGALEPGASVFIEYDGAWYPGNVIEARGDLYRVHYEGWDPSTDEDVDTERLRRR